jgi:hypothetical protein
MVQVPSLTARLDIVREDPDVYNRSEQFRAILRDCKHLESCLMEWYARMGTPLTRSTSDCTILGTFFSYSYETVNVSSWPLNLMYWSALHVLYSVMLACYTSVAESNSSDAQEAEGKMCSTAMDIARSIPYFLRPEMNDIGPQMVLFHICIAIQYFQTRTDELAKWPAAVLQCLDDRGVPCRGFLTDVMRNFHAATLE